MLLGDANLNVSDTDDNAVLSYKNMLSSIGCENLSRVPTNFWAKGRSTLDHVITSIECDMIKAGTNFWAKGRSTLDHVITNIECDMIKAGVLNNGKPGHLPIFAIVKNHNDPKSTLSNHIEETKWRCFDDKKKKIS